MKKTFSIIVSGKVQGVYYRQSTKSKAIEFGIVGVVQNLKNGDVHIFATGTDIQLTQLTSWCRQGPAAAIVKHVEVTEIPLQEFDNFKIIRF
ncbi:MAG TPA: acylphosphatase [Chitinophagaceae bacterium]|nr:acylphosphatase [Chitinophagaceae bacterium]